MANQLIFFLVVKPIFTHMQNKEMQITMQNVQSKI